MREKRRRTKKNIATTPPLDPSNNAPPLAPA
jgi:hypothetical protein